MVILVYFIFLGECRAP